jgi:hypothetical protein
MKPTNTTATQFHDNLVARGGHCGSGSMLFCNPCIARGGYSAAEEME